MILVAGLGFLLTVVLLGLAALCFALVVVLKIIEWSMRLGLWLLNKERQTGDLVINIYIAEDDDDQQPLMKDVTPRSWMRRIRDR